MDIKWEKRANILGENRDAWVAEKPLYFTDKMLRVALENEKTISRFPMVNVYRIMPDKAPTFLASFVHMHHAKGFAEHILQVS